MSRVQDALDAAGAVLKRSKKHRVYVLPNGNKVTMAGTPSDWRVEQEQLKTIRRAAADRREKD